MGRAIPHPWLPTTIPRRETHVPPRRETRRREWCRRVPRKYSDQILKIRSVDGFVQSHDQRFAVEHPQINAVVGGAGQNGGLAIAHRHPQGVKNRVFPQLKASGGEHGRQGLGVGLDASGDRPQPLWPMVHRVHAGHDGQ